MFFFPSFHVALNSLAKNFWLQGELYRVFEKNPSLVVAEKMLGKTE